MVYNLKTYKEYIEKAVLPQKVTPDRTTPFILVKTEKGYLYSDLKIEPIEDSNNSIYKRKAYCFCFHYKDFTIQEKSVLYISYYIGIGNNIYKKYSVDHGNILDETDLEDFILVIHKQPKVKLDSFDSSYDLSIYDGFKKLCELRNVNRLVPLKTIDKNKVLYYRRNRAKTTSYHDERWVFMNGQEYSESSLNLSLSEWNILFQPNINSFWNLQRIYDNKNVLPFVSKDLFWNSNRKCKWECSMGHKWIAPVRDLTEKPIHNNYCPTCQKLVPAFHYTSTEEEAKNVYNKLQLAKEEYKTNNLEEILVYLDEDISKLKELQEKGILWFDHSKMPNTVNYVFTFPSGKHGDIDKSICESYGIVVQNSEFVYKATISTDNYKAIELLCESYSPIELPPNMDNAELKSFLTKHNVMYRLSFLSSLAHIFDMPKNICFSIDKEMTKYRALLREKRTEIYNTLIGENKSTRKWTSEQTLYQFVKKYFSDAIFQYKTTWLGNQSLDIFIPSINVGIEYHGLQHYKPVDYFGGKEQFDIRVKLDHQKRILCQNNGIILIEWKYTKKISVKNVRITLGPWM